VSDLLSEFDDIIQLDPKKRYRLKANGREFIIFGSVVKLEDGNQVQLAAGQPALIGCNFYTDFSDVSPEEKSLWLLTHDGEIKKWEGQST
jgi:hypothetical protein